MHQERLSDAIAVKSKAASRTIHDRFGWADVWNYVMNDTSNILNIVVVRRVYARVCRPY
jgi:hypothetical protein